MAIPPLTAPKGFKYEDGKVQWISEANPGDAFLYEEQWEHILSLRLDPRSHVYYVATVDSDNDVHLREIAVHGYRVLLSRRRPDRQKNGDNK